MESKRVKKQEGTNEELNVSERIENTQQTEKKENKKSREETGRIILGLRFSGKRLHLVFKGQGGTTEHWVLGRARLADNQWHTLVLAVSSHHVRLTVDCNSPLEM